MADTEKITINLSVVDLGKVDLLVAEGFYSNRTDFIRTAIRNQLDKQAGEVKASVSRRAMAVGVFGVSRSHLEKLQKKGETLRIHTVGLLILEDDISPELAQVTIESIKVFGSFHANKAVKEALADRTS
jgi:Arc/MetJ-type ribon-helix-helix transcriptional regulator